MNSKNDALAACASAVSMSLVTLRAALIDEPADLSPRVRETVEFCIGLAPSICSDPEKGSLIASEIRLIRFDVTSDAKALTLFAYMSALAAAETFEKVARI